MNRLLLVLAALAAVAIPATVADSAPPKTVNVTNPMTADLNGGGHGIENVSDIVARSLDTQFLYVQSDTIQIRPWQSPTPLSIVALSYDPSTIGYSAAQGSLVVGTTGLWRKSGPGPYDWTLVSG